MDSEASTLLGIATRDASSENGPVERLDLPRYAGNWYVIAHVPSRAERRGVDSVTATYLLNADGTVAVRNAYRNAKGLFVEANAIARTTTIPGALKQRFAPRWLSWLPSVWSDYWVIDLDPSYQWAMVGSPTRKTLSVRSRHPTMKRALYERLIRAAARRGYRVADLVMTSELE